MTNSNDSYLSRGVSPTKDEVKAAIADMDKGLFPNAFCQISEDPAGDPDYCFALHADGAGTKSSLAYLMYKETGDYRFFHGIAQDSLVMNTDDLACVGATGGFFLSNTIGRNAHRVDGEAIAEVIRGYRDLVEELNALGCSIQMTGGETADVGDLVRTLICDSTIAVRMKKENVIDLANVREGLVIVGLSSSGQATYEKQENSGIASNGLTAARHLLLDHRYAALYPETYSDTLDPDKVYSGKHDVLEALEGTSLTYGEAILSPTRTFLPLLNKILPAYKQQIHGIVHCTGGGQVKCKDFGRGIHYVKNDLFELPAIFKSIYAGGEIEARELYQVFNCGHLMELYVDEESAQGIIDLAASFNIEAKIVGYTKASADEKNHVTIQSALGEFHY